MGLNAHPIYVPSREAKAVDPFWMHIQPILCGIRHTNAPRLATALDDDQRARHLVAYVGTRNEAIAGGAFGKW
jgi:hypothetical protein